MELPKGQQKDMIVSKLEIPEIKPIRTVVYFHAIHALNILDDNKSATAKALGISRSTLHRILSDGL